MFALSMPALAEADAARRVVSMSPSLTEILIAVGARATLVGVDSYSKKVSPEVADLPTIGGLFNPSLEAVVALEPDLVTLVPSAQQRDFTNRLEALGIEVLGLPNITLADVLSSIVTLGERVGRGTAARAVVARIRENWRAIAEATSSFEPPSAVLVIQREPLYVVGAGSFIDAMLTASGLKNAAGIFEEPYPRVAVEWLIEAAPEVILDATETAVEPSAYWSRWAFPSGRRRRSHLRGFGQRHHPTRSRARSCAAHHCGARSRCGRRWGARNEWRGCTVRATGASIGLTLGVLSVALIGASFFGLGAGPSAIPPGDVARALLHAGIEGSTADIVLRVRLPRVILAVLVGASLSVSGVLFQALLRNPLADPFVLGVSGGAALGGIAVLALGNGIGLGYAAVPPAAFAGAVVTTFILFAVAGIRGRVSATHLLLTGVVFNAIASAAIVFLASTAGLTEGASIFLWLIGNLSATRIDIAGWVAVFSCSDWRVRSQWPGVSTCSHWARSQPSSSESRSNATSGSYWSLHR